MLLWLEESEDRSLNRAPVLGGDRFFDGISFVSISDRFSDRSRLRSKKVSKKESKRIQNWKTWSLLGCDWGDGHKVNRWELITSKAGSIDFESGVIWLAAPPRKLWNIDRRRPRALKKCCNIGLISDLITLVLENCSFSPPKGFVL